jgi:hypothetical protein
MTKNRTGASQPPLDARGRRERQSRSFRLNQIFGVLMVAAAILLTALLRTNPQWIFTPGWWRP